MESALFFKEPQLNAFHESFCSNNPFTWPDTTFQLILLHFPLWNNIGFDEQLTV